MGNSLKKLCNSIRIRSTCVSTCCSDNTKQEVVLSPIASEEIKVEHSHHIEHHESIENIGGGIILHKIEDKIICLD